MKAISLNANGLRAAWRKGLDAWLAAERPDLVFLQELKWNDADALRALFPDWMVYLDLAVKPGYSGVAILSRAELDLVAVPELPDELMGEGRYVAGRLDGVVWLNLYLPSGSQGPQRQALKLVALEGLARWMARQEGPSVLGGDWNLAPSAEDVHDPKRLDGAPGFTKEEREWWQNQRDLGWYDGFRHCHPDASEVYSWWSARSGAHARNKGWRIDHWVTNAPQRVAGVAYASDARFSDHAPMRLHWS